MRFKKPFERPIPTSPGIGRSRGRPDWLTEWLENRGQYVLLSCGHKEDLKYGHLLIIHKFGLDKGRIVMCERCNIWVSVARPITMQDYFGLPALTTHSEPMF